MSVEGGGKIIKILLFVFNFIFWIIGLILLGIGIWALADPKIKEYTDDKFKDYEVVSEFVSQVKAASIVVIIVAVVVIITGFCGCCGAIKESKILLVIYVIILSIIFIALLAISIWALVKKDTIWDEIKTKTTDILNKEIEERNKKQAAGDVQKGVLMPVLENNFGCCGVTGISQYNTRSMCVAQNSTTADTIDVNKGCVEPFIQFAKDNVVIIGGTGLGLGLVLIIGIIFGLCLFCSIE